MSQALMDWVSARHDAIGAVLDTLAAEHQLSDAESSVLDLTGAEREMDVTAARLADAVDALPDQRKPVGWDQAPEAGSLQEARTRFVRAVLRALAAQYAEESADAAADAEYADDMMSLAARDLRARGGAP